MKFLWSELPDNLSEAWLTRSRYYMTGKPCKKGHHAPRWARNSNCTACARHNAWMRQYGASMPPWADVAAIDALYDLAARLSAETGIPHEVDHIIPRRHPLVCGLHIPANLQVITKEENFAKSNRWEDM